jgi:hypothetical protein
VIAGDVPVPLHPPSRSSWYQAVSRGAARGELDQQQITGFALRRRQYPPDDGYRTDMGGAQFPLSTVCSLHLDPRRWAWRAGPLNAIASDWFRRPLPVAAAPQGANEMSSRASRPGSATHQPSSWALAPARSAVDLAGSIPIPALTLSEPGAKLTVPAPLPGPSIQDVLAANQTGKVKAPPAVSITVPCGALSLSLPALPLRQVRKCQCHDPNHLMLIQFIAYIWTF